MSLTPEKAYEIWIKLCKAQESLAEITFDLFDIFTHEFISISQKQYKSNLWLKDFKEEILQNQQKQNI